MLAALGGDDDVVAAIAADHNVVVANDNAPGQRVLSGATRAIEAAKVALRDAGVRVLELNVSGAFHSPLMAPAVPEWTAALEATEIGTPRLPVYSCVTAAPIDDIRRRLAEAPTAPVRWRETVLALQAAGVEHFEDAGPGRVLACQADRRGEAHDPRPGSPIAVPGADRSAPSPASASPSRTRSSSTRRSRRDWAWTRTGSSRAPGSASAAARAGRAARRPRDAGRRAGLAERAARPGDRGHVLVRRCPAVRRPRRWPRASARARASTSTPPAPASSPASQLGRRPDRVRPRATPSSSSAPSTCRSCVDPDDRGPAAIFADGAGAALLRAPPAAASSARSSCSREHQRDLLYADRADGPARPHGRRRRLQARRRRA